MLAVRAMWGAGAATLLVAGCLGGGSAPLAGAPPDAVGRDPVAAPWPFLPARIAADAAAGLLRDEPPAIAGAYALAASAPAKPAWTPGPRWTPQPKAAWTPGPKWTPAPKPVWTPGPKWTPAPRPAWTPQAKPSWTPQPKPSWTPQPKPSWTPQPKPSWTPQPRPSWTPSPRRSSEARPSTRPSRRPAWSSGRYDRDDRSWRRGYHPRYRDDYDDYRYYSFGRFLFPYYYDTGSYYPYLSDYYPFYYYTDAGDYAPFYLGQSAGEPETEARVVMIAGQFWPEAVRVRTGGSVVWLNADAVAHTATSADARLAFDTGSVAPGTASQAIAFDRPGRWAYRCTIHPDLEGEISVE